MKKNLQNNNQQKDGNNMNKVKKVKEALFQINETLDRYPEAEWTMGYLNEVLTKLPKLSEDNALDWTLCLVEAASTIAVNSPITSEEREFGINIMNIIKNVTLGVEMA